MNVLFVCTRNVQRSKTAEDVFKELTRGKSGFSIRSAGTNAKASLGGVQLTLEHLRWADKVFVMEQAHVNYISSRFPDYAGKVINLAIDDVFYRGDGTLVMMLREKLKHYATG